MKHYDNELFFQSIESHKDLYLGEVVGAYNWKEFSQIDGPISVCGGVCVGGGGMSWILRYSLLYYANLACSHFKQITGKSLTLLQTNITKLQELKLFWCYTWSKYKSCVCVWLQTVYCTCRRCVDDSKQQVVYHNEPCLNQVNH